MNPDLAELPLRPLHAAATPPWWPPALGWWLLLLVLLLAILLGGRILSRLWRQRRLYRRLLIELAVIETRHSTLNDTLPALSCFARRVAIHVGGYSTLAGCVGPRWAETLSRAVAVDGRHDATTHALAHGPYQAQPAVALPETFAFVRLWVAHCVARSARDV